MRHRRTLGRVPTSSFTTISGPVTAQIEVKRSRFLCRLERVATEEQARAVIEAARREHWDARHHCSAFSLGPAGHVQRSSDDGEPAGTAGMPILEVLRGRELSDVVAVVSRWFGGTLLGAGGLGRAYGDATRLAVEQSRAVTRQLVTLGGVTVPHADAGRLENGLRARGVVVRGTDYATEATVRIAVRAEELDQAQTWVAELTGGTGQLALGDQEWIDL